MERVLALIRSSQSVPVPVTLFTSEGRMNTSWKKNWNKRLRVHDNHILHFVTLSWKLASMDASMTRERTTTFSWSALFFIASFFLASNLSLFSLLLSRSMENKQLTVN